MTSRQINPDRDWNRKRGRSQKRYIFFSVHEYFSNYGSEEWQGYYYYLWTAMVCSPMRRVRNTDLDSLPTYAGICKVGWREFIILWMVVSTPGCYCSWQWYHIYYHLCIHLCIWPHTVHIFKTTSFGNINSVSWFFN